MGIRKVVCDCTCGAHNTQDLKKLAEFCHSLGLAYLRIKASTNRLYMFHGEKLEDLTWDFIADLFETENNGRLKVFCDYFEDKSPGEMNCTDIESELRKLVFTKVEDNIFKAIGENDPSLKKIIRNVKLAVRSNGYEHTVCCNNGHLVIKNQPGNNLPVMPSDIMQIHLSSRVREKMQIPEIVAEVIDILLHQDQYMKKFSLIGLSLIIREIFVHFNKDMFTNESEPASVANLMNSEFKEMLNKSVRSVKMKIGYRYVQSEKINLILLNAYMEAANNIVKEQFGSNDEGRTQFDYLKEEMPELNYMQFREKHRQILEYLVKQVRTNLIYTYKKDWA